MTTTLTQNDLRLVCENQTTQDRAMKLYERHQTGDITDSELVEQVENLKQELQERGVVQ